METKSLPLEQLIDLEFEAQNSESALQSIGKMAIQAGLARESWADALVEREAKFATGLPTEIAVAIPHTDSMHVRADGFGFFRLKNPVEFIEMGTDDSPIQVQMIFPLLITNPADQVDLLQAVIGLIQKPGILAALASAKTQTEVLKILKES
jgi:PTS system galactitol-specific IIA component